MPRPVFLADAHPVRLRLLHELLADAGYAVELVQHAHSILGRLAGGDAGACVLAAACLDAAPARMVRRLQLEGYEVVVLGHPRRQAAVPLRPVTYLEEPVNLDALLLALARTPRDARHLVLVRP